jgi:putative ubiquitin-RnfH superfamily antitoxin RatB of RatAB toxin-antitoxin module
MPRLERPSRTTIVDPATDVEVVYALPERQHVVIIKLPAEGLSALEACERSGLLEAHDELRARPLVLGVFGELCSHDRRLRAGDRVEIYRPLKHDPRDTRRARAARANSGKKSGQ